VAASVSLVLRKDKARADGRCPVYLRITRDRRTNYVATGVRVLPSQWNADKGRVKPGHDIADTLNARLASLSLKAEKNLFEGRTAKQVKVSLSSTSGEVVSFLDQYIRLLTERSQLWEQRKYEVLRRKLVDCFGAQLKWTELSADAVSKFETYLRVRRKNNPNTVAKELSRLRRIVREAVRQDVLEAASDPFIKFRMPRGQQVHRRKLSPEEIRALMAAILDARAAVARDVFLFSFFAGGMRFGDVARLRVQGVKDGRVSYEAMKTGKQMNLGVPPVGVEIAERYAMGKKGSEYLFPLLTGKRVDSPSLLRRAISSANSSANMRLKAAAKKAGVEDEGLSMHIARHSYADLARRKSGNLHAIMQSLGHSRLAVTQTYLKSLDEDAVDTLTKQVWEGF
jgi:integrase